MKAIGFALLLSVIGSATAASASVSFVPATCKTYFGGEPDLPPEEAARLPEGGMMRICRPDAKPNAPSYTVATKPLISEQGICRFTYRERGSGNTMAVDAVHGLCPRPDDKSYSVLLGGASDDDYLDAQLLFRALAGPGIQGTGPMIAGMVTFGSMEIGQPRLYSVTRLSPATLEIEVRSDQSDYSGHILKFDVVDGQYRLKSWATWIA